MTIDKETKGLDLGPLALALILAAVLFSAAFYFSPDKGGTVQMVPGQTHAISLSADATREVAPDKVELIFSVVSRGPDPAAIQAQNDAQLRQIRSALLDAGVPDSNIKTVGYSLERWSEWNKTLEASVDKGYVLSNRLRVVSYDPGLAGRIVQSAVQNGANSVDGIQFSLSDAARRQVYGELLANASAQVREKAQSMAAAAGIKLQGLAQMSEGYSSVEPMANSYRALDAKAYGAPGAGEVSISAGLVRVSASVSASYEVEG